MQIRSVHYDLTDLCNAGCPQCARTDPDGCRPRGWLTHSVCSLEKFRRLSPPAFLAGLNSAYFCGNFGDPAVVPDLIDTRIHRGM
jgi:molybdenum cofactor biosynthesis enzyme MoaA